MDYFEGYLESLVLDGTYSKNTIEAYTGDVHRFSDYLERQFPGKNVPVRVTSAMILDFLNEEFQGGYSVNTLQRRKMALAHFAHYLLSVQMFSLEGIREILGWQRKNWHAIYSQKANVLTEDEIDLLLQPAGPGITAIMKRDLAIVAVMLDAALHVGQVTDLKVSYFKVQDGVWRLNGQNLAVSTAFLKRYHEEGRPEFAPSKDEDTFFLSQRGGPISRQGLWQIVKELGENRGIKKPVSPGILRNTAVARMLADGVETSELQKLLGHTNISSTRALVRKLKRTIL